MNTFGRHLLVELFGCDRSLLNDKARIEAIVAEAVDVSGATAITSLFHAFEPQGVTGVVVLAESHLSVHTWPETGYAAIDFYTCGVTCDPYAGAEVLSEGLAADRQELLLVERGCRPEPSMNVVEHTVTGKDVPGLKGPTPN